MEKAPLWETQILAIQETQGEDIETVAELTDGYTIVRILSPKALQRESDLMGNCIYKDHSEKIVTSGIEYAYSLRNANNKPHVTLLSCLVPQSCGILYESIKEVDLWAVYTMLTPRRRFAFEKKYKSLKRASLN